jgi:hypothetical protein
LFAEIKNAHAAGLARHADGRGWHGKTKNAAMRRGVFFFLPLYLVRLLASPGIFFSPKTIENFEGGGRRKRKDKEERERFFGITPRTG